jgi:hypothetical protein
MAKKQEKMLTIPGHKGNANQHYIKILSPIRIYHQKDHQEQMLVRIGRKRNPHTLLVGM